ncbi:MAG: hypothetical protein MJ228_04720 [Bacilli bacterium]|nr:hypothetical protein [Bacilli bacterium]
MDKVKKSKFTLLITSLCSGALLLSSGFSLAWFYNEKKIDIDDGLTGSVLQKYFHSGTGKSTDPFIITRPRHYENMVLLHYNLEGFAEHEFYYEIGTDMDGDGVKEVYNYSKGRVEYVNGSPYSTTLNCDRIASLAPLGSKELPFNSHIQGNGMTVSGFKIDATRGQYSDIGIFGFVGYGTCLNTYFSNFEIDTTGTHYDEPTDEELASGTEHLHNDGAIHMGYIAGHLDQTENFQNVYVNNCTLKGTTNGLHVNNYGYYGRAEQDALGGGLGYGRDYTFSLNSQSVFNYFNSTYNSIKDDQLVLKNTRETADVAPNKDGDKIKRMTANDQTAVPFSTAVSPDSAAGSGTYVINNGYSLSTAGYTSPEFVENRHEYNVYYQDREYVDKDDGDHSHNGQNKIPASTPLYYDHSLKGAGEGLIVDNSDPENRKEYPTAYYFWDSASNSYKYGESYDRKVIKDVDVYPVKLTFNDFTSEPFTSAVTPSINSLNIDARLFFDDPGINGNAYNFIALTVHPTISSNGISRTIKMSFDPIQLSDVQEGIHHFSILLSFTFGTWFTGTHRSIYLYPKGGYDETANTLEQDAITVNDAKAGKQLNLSDKSAFWFKDYGDISNTKTPYNDLIDASKNLIRRIPFSFEDSKDIIHVDPRTFETPLKYKEVIDGVEQEEFIEVGGLTSDSHTNFNYVPGVGENHGTWKLIVVTRDVVDNPDTLDYFPSEDSIIYGSGYRSRNIDVVGGGAEFYYRKIGNTNIAVLALKSEQTAGQRVGLPPTKGQPFYANEQCSSSIVVYLKNTSNAIDDRDDLLGKISFTYVQVSFFGNGIEVVDPTFKKGDGFMSLKSAGTNTVESNDGGFINLTHTISLDLLESDVKKVAYCGLDADGNVVGRYTSSGVWDPLTSEPQTDEQNERDQAKIDTYVLVLGGQSNNANNDTWITNIDFEYKAQDGYGGTFGSIGYRSATDEKIENTILNYYLSNPTAQGKPADFSYYVNVKYVSKDPEDTEYTKKGRYYITCYSDTDVKLKIFNYYPELYDVYVKSDPDGDFVQATGSKPEVTIEASTIPTS